MMKKITTEALFIFILSLLISIAYTAASPSGTNLLRKAFGMPAVERQEEVNKAGQGPLTAPDE